MKGVKIIYSDDEIAWLKANQKGISRAELTKRFNEKFNRGLSAHNIKQVCLRNGWLNGFTGCFEKRKAPWNKGKKGFMGANRTSFKKGNAPQNKLPIGTTRVSKDGYHEIKVAEPNKWQLKHRVEWEKHNGKPNKNEVVVFKDGNKDNWHIDNLLLVHRGALAIANKMFSEYPNEYKETVYLMAQLRHRTSKK